MMKNKARLLLVLLALNFQPAVVSDVWTTRDGRRIEGRKLRVAENKVFLELSSSEGPKAETSLSLSSIAKAEFAEPPEVGLARARWEAGDSKATVQMLEPLVEEALPWVRVSEAWIPKMILLFSEALLKSGDSDRAVQFAAILLRQTSDRELADRTRMVKLRAHRDRGDVSEAEAEANRIVAESVHEPFQAEAGFHLAQLKLSRGDPEAALEGFLRLAVLQPRLDSWRTAAFLEAAKLRFTRGEPQLAASMLRELRVLAKPESETSAAAAALLQSWKMAEAPTESIPEFLKDAEKTKPPAAPVSRSPSQSADKSMKSKKP